MAQGDFSIRTISRLHDFKLIDAKFDERIDEKDKTKDYSKIQLLGICRSLAQATSIIFESQELEQSLRLMGDKCFTKVKVLPEDWQQFQKFGVKKDSILVLDVSPEFYSISNGRGNSNQGIWYKPISLISIDGRQVNYQIIKPPKRKELPSVLSGGLNLNFGDLDETEYQIQNELAEFENA